MVDQVEETKAQMWKLSSQRWEFGFNSNVCGMAVTTGVRPMYDPSDLQHVGFEGVSDETETYPPNF